MSLHISLTLSHSFTSFFFHVISLSQPPTWLYLPLPVSSVYSVLLSFLPFFTLPLHLTFSLSSHPLPPFTFPPPFKSLYFVFIFPYSASLFFYYLPYLYTFFSSSHLPTQSLSFLPSISSFLLFLVFLISLLVLLLHLPVPNFITPCPVAYLLPICYFSFVLSFLFFLLYSDNVFFSIWIFPNPYTLP